jgi:hypothetical protein
MPTSVISPHILTLSQVEEQRNTWRQSYMAYQQRYLEFQSQQADFLHSCQNWQERHRIFQDMRDDLKREAEIIKWRRLTQRSPIW